MNEFDPTIENTGTTEEIKIVDEPKEDSSDYIEQKVPQQYTNPNVTLQVEPRLERKPSGLEPLGISNDNMNSVKEKLANPFVTESIASFSEEQREAINKAWGLIPNSDVMEKAQLGENKEYTQYVQADEKLITPVIPTWSTPTGTMALTGLKAIARMQKALNQGTFFTFPCWASGIWVTLRNPDGFDLANYYDMIEQEKIRLGRNTSGAIFSNNQVYINAYMMDLAEKLLYDCSIKTENPDFRLRDIIVMEDLETIAWALACSMYPNGYPFVEPCTANLGSCNEVIEETINLTKLYWVDKKKLTKWQIDFMKDPKVKRSVDEVRKYQLESSWCSSSEKTYKNFTLYIKNPTVAEHIESGYKWIADIEESIRTVAQDADDAQLNRRVMERAGLTLLRTYSHYIKSIKYPDGSVVTTREDIDTCINLICSEPELITKITEDIKEYMASNNVSFIAINKHICPGCEKKIEDDVNIHPHLTPISAMKLFSALRDLRIQLG